jgi:hypothetical protein
MSKDFTEKQLDLILDVMCNFDFEKVQVVMQSLNWTWACTENGVPDVFEIKDVAKGLLKDSIMHCTEEDNGMTVETGGLQARYVPDNGDGEEWLSLRFILEESSSTC